MDLIVRGSGEHLRANNVICLARTYREHALELGNAVPESPLVFLKPNSALVGDGADIVLPATSREVHHEIELAVIVGRAGRRIPVESALEHVLGYAILLDITARDIQSDLKKRGLSWTLAKGWDTFAPISVVTPAAEINDPGELELRLTVSGEVRQASSTRNMMFSVAEIVAFVSGFMTVQPGDVIATGTPEGVGPLVAGDTTRAEITGLGVLCNQVVADAP